jgi:hypothetical protein
LILRVADIDKLDTCRIYRVLKEIRQISLYLTRNLCGMLVEIVRVLFRFGIFLSSDRLHCVEILF